MYDYQMFRTVHFKGFDRDEVIAFIQSLEEENNRKVADLQKEIKDRDKMIEELSVDTAGTCGKCIAACPLAYID